MGGRERGGGAALDEESEREEARDASGAEERRRRETMQELRQTSASQSLSLKPAERERAGGQRGARAAIARRRPTHGTRTRSLLHSLFVQLRPTCMMRVLRTS